MKSTEESLKFSHLHKEVWFVKNGLQEIGEVMIKEETNNKVAGVKMVTREEELKNGDHHQKNSHPNKDNKKNGTKTIEEIEDNKTNGTKAPQIAPLAEEDNKIDGTKAPWIAPEEVNKIDGTKAP